MAETTEKIKKAKAPAKPKATADPAKATTAKKAATKTPASKKTNGAEVIEINSTPLVPNHHDIATLALQYWEQRGRAHGHDQQDWLRAEQELMKMAS